MECVDNLRYKLGNLSFRNFSTITREGIQVADRSWEVSALENLRRMDTAHSSAMRNMAGMCFCQGLAQGDTLWNYCLVILLFYI